MHVWTGAGWELRQGSCFDQMSGLPSLADASVDHMVTDPPYSQHTHEKQWIGAALTESGAKRVKTAHAGLGFAHVTEEEAAAFMGQAARVTRRWVLVFTDIEGVDMWKRTIIASGLDYVRTCIWDKVDGAPQFTGDRPAAGAEAFVLAHQPGRRLSGEAARPHPGQLDMFGVAQ